MSVRSEILDQFTQVAHEQDRRLGPLSDELPLLDSGLDSLCFAIDVSRLEAGYDRCWRDAAAWLFDRRPNIAPPLSICSRGRRLRPELRICADSTQGRHP